MPADLDISQSATLTDVAMCVNRYRLATPGIYVCVHAQVQLIPEIRLVPGLIAQVNYGKHKQCDAGDYKLFSGPPNFVFDVFKEGEIGEYETRRQHFEQAGVLEYAAWHNGAPLPSWDRLVDGTFREITEDEPGLITSTALPGLWLPIKPLQDRDWWTILASIDRGISRRPHHEFMEAIWNA